MRDWARSLKREVVALGLAARHPGTPWYAKWLVLAVVAYALSPIDLIPDFIPVLGYLDDVILLPLGILLARRLVPAAVMAECRAEATAREARGPSSRIAGGIIIGIWLLVAASFAYVIYAWISHHQP